jgi:hypothetical protein
MAPMLKWTSLHASALLDHVRALLGLTQAKALDRASQIRTYVESASLRVAELPVEGADFDRWAEWAKREADRIDPVKNGTITQAVNKHSGGE